MSEKLLCPYGTNSRRCNITGKIAGCPKNDNLESVVSELEEKQGELRGDSFSAMLINYCAQVDGRNVSRRGGV